MYEPHAHAKLNAILDTLEAERPERRPNRHFHTRLGANFYAIHRIYDELYGHRDDALEHLEDLVRTLSLRYEERSAELTARDREREADPGWFLHQRWVGMALYTDGFAGDIAGTEARLPYLQELGVNLVHLMPLLKCPPKASDGGYAVSDFRDVDPRVGTLSDLRSLTEEMRARDMLVVLDVVINHTSDQHSWAKWAREGEATYRDFYYTYEDRQIPDRFEQSMPEIFPEHAPGNFTWSDELQRWVMTVFHDYQWDLNYTNPAVLVAMVDVLLYWANEGADVLRLDAVAFIWKRLGTASQNQPEAHLLLQLMKDCAQVVAPGVLFLAEAIVAPSEITRYFGEDAVGAKECDIAYNATLMALLWDAVATRNTRLLRHGLSNQPPKHESATWLDYVRCHDDVGLGFDDADVVRAGYQPHAHRKFLVDWFTGNHQWSDARGAPFGLNRRTGDVRFTGALASLVGLESALESEDETRVDQAIARILMLHGVILSVGGIPLLYYGDELGTLNDYSYRDDPSKSQDNRWLNRPQLTDDQRERRHQVGSPAHRIFSGLQHLIAQRKTLPAFADHNNRQLCPNVDEHLLAYIRTPQGGHGEAVLVVANFADEPRQVELASLPGFHRATVVGHDRVSGHPLDRHGVVTVEPFSIAWLPTR